jgi:hypothetical protein
MKYQIMYSRNIWKLLKTISSYSNVSLEFGGFSTKFEIAKVKPPYERGDKSIFKL